MCWEVSPCWAWGGGGRRTIHTFLLPCIYFFKKNLDSLWKVFSLSPFPPSFLPSLFPSFLSSFLPSFFPFFHALNLYFSFPPFPLPSPPLSYFLFIYALELGGRLREQDLFYCLIVSLLWWSSIYLWNMGVHYIPGFKPGFSTPNLFLKASLNNLVCCNYIIIVHY